MPFEAGASGPHVIDLSSSTSPFDLDSCLSRIDPVVARAAASFAFRVSAELFARLEGADAKPAREEVLRRAPSLRLTVLTYRGEAHVARYIEPDGLSPDPTDNDALVSEIRQADMLRVISDCRDLCYYRSNARHHYVAPSKQHCSFFFRLGDALRSRGALDRLAFWLQPHVARAGALLVDTWSISSIVLRALQAQRLHVAFDCLSAHPQQDRASAEAIVGELVAGLPEGARLTCIISVTSSGTFAARIAELCGSKVQLDTVALYRLAGTPRSVPALCELPESPQNYPADDCPMCNHGSKPIALHPALYYLKEYPEDEIALAPPNFYDAPPPEGMRHDPTTLIARFHHVPGLLSVHHDDRHRRHHAFHVNVGALLGEQEFVARFHERLRSVTTAPDLIVTPSDAVSVRLGEMARERFQCPHLKVDSLRNHTLLGEDGRALLRARRRWLVLDDVFISGGRIGAFLRDLRETEPPESVHFLVGLARCPSGRDWRRHQDVVKRHGWASLDAVEQFFVPNWDRRQCPWCREYEFFTHVTAPLAEPPEWMLGRIAALTERGRGVVAPLLLLPSVAARTLGGTSYVGPSGLSDMATLFSVVSALQRLRTDEDDRKRLDPHFPSFRVFAVRNLETNYTEGLLRATFLRVVAPAEWGLTTQPGALTTFLARVARETDQDVLLGELLLAMARGGVDRSILGSLQEVYQRHLGDLAAPLLEVVRRF
jgi:hypothetical protein